MGDAKAFGKALVVVLTVVAGCGGSPARAPDRDGPGDGGAQDGARDARASEAPRVDAGPDVVCCPINVMCSCFYVGGHAQSLASCPMFCDSVPVTWSTSTDDAGCPVLEWGPPLRACNPP